MLRQKHIANHVPRNPEPPLRLAQLLRQLQEDSQDERDVSIGLDIDEAIYIDAGELLLAWVMEQLLANALAMSKRGTQLVLGCRSDEDGVVLEIEHQVDCGRQAMLAIPADGGNELMSIAVRAIPAELSVLQTTSERLVRLTLPDTLRRTYAPPGLGSASNV